MINIDTRNGKLTIDKWVFHAHQNSKDIEMNLSPPDIDKWTSNENWVTYRIHINKEFIITTYFENDILKMIDIYSTNDGDNSALVILKKLGDENTYKWGKVELNNDIKAGYQSVVIKYV